MTKIRCGIRENAKYLGGKQDSTDTREAGCITIWAGVSGFSWLSVGNSGSRTFKRQMRKKPGERSLVSPSMKASYKVT